MSSELAILKTFTLGAIAQAPAEIKACYEQATKDLQALATEYINQGPNDRAICAFALALPIFMLELNDFVEAKLKEKKKPV